MAEAASQVSRVKKRWPFLPSRPSSGEGAQLHMVPQQCWGPTSPVPAHKQKLHTERGRPREPGATAPPWSTQPLNRAAPWTRVGHGPAPSARGQASRSHGEEGGPRRESPYSSPHTDFTCGRVGRGPSLKVLAETAEAVVKSCQEECGRVYRDINKT